MIFRENDRGVLSDNQRQRGRPFPKGTSGNPLPASVLAREIEQQWLPRRFLSRSRGRAQKPDGRELRSLLRARRERPCRRYAAKYKNKFSPPNGDCHVTLSRIWLPLYLIFS